MPDPPTLHQKALTLPPLPGVYLMKDARGGVLYIGKAKNLKARLTQYFGALEQRGHALISVGLEHVRDFDYIVVSSEHEALVLENSLIKQHAPKYNINLKDDKGHRWVRVTREDWPRMAVAKQKHDDGADYLGPYTSAYAVKLAVDEAKQVFKLPTCSLQFPRDIGKSRPCLQHFIGRCDAPCAKKIGHEAYLQSMRGAVAFLRRGSLQSEKELRLEMEQAAENLEFERAARLRDTLRAIERLREKQHVVSVSVEEQDVSALAAEQSQACWAVLRFAGGKLYDSEQFFLPRPEHYESARQELLERYYSMRGEKFPRRVLLDGETEDPALLEEWLSAMAGHKVTVQAAQKGEPAQLVALCRQNAVEQLAHRLGRPGKGIAALEELARLLGLPAPPQVIEAYDISHTAGSDNVAGMVVFQNGAPLKAAYKRFAIKGFAGQDDYASMAEVLDRRLTRYAETGNENAERGNAQGFGKLPDLILLDGGLGQVHAVEPVLARHNLHIPLFGMVKDGRHRTRAIASGGGEIAFNATKAAFALVTAIQDEAHRFAVAYHHKKREKSAFGSELTKIPGIGPARARALLGHFKTMKAIREAGEEELAKAPGMNVNAAKAVKEYFEQKEGPP
ncbi:MAG: excinuclease ABC subunit UvrC [Oscillospiraceae bacterium]|jgi:excinuclease ABC subunit C|nr:excinuclease ABC subunit UvrC [Oscillospiraceae bacterium]